MAHPASTSVLLDEIQEVGKSYVSGDTSARLRLLDLCGKLEREVERPAETLFKLGWARPVHFLALRLATQMKFWDTLGADGDAPKTDKDLAEPCNADPRLAGRIARHLAAMGTLREVAPDTYSHTSFSILMQAQAAQHTIEFLFDYAKQVHLATGPFLQQTAYQNPTDPRNLPYQKAFGPDQTFFESLAADPEKGTRFTSMMEAESQGKASFADDHAYPVLERLQSVRDDGEVLIVDCGAGNGSDMRHFRVKHPNLKGRVIVQDMPYIFEEDTKLEASLKNDGIEVMRHDFFTPQPIAGAQVYFLRQIMQDYSDERCLQILSQIVSVMRSGYSKILITETILPDKGAHWFTTSLDLELMIHLAAFKRTETQMRELLAKAGLAVTGFFKLPESFDSVLEGMLPNSS